MLDDASRLLAAFDDGTLVRPNWRVLNTIDLVRGIAFLAGVRDIAPSHGMQQVVQTIGESDHLVFVLIDALGTNIINRLPQTSLLRRSMRTELQAICPSTTAAVLTSVAAGEWPNRHAVTGWWTHLPEFGFTSTLLQWIDRFTYQSMSARGLAAADVLPAPSLFPRIPRDTRVFVPSSFADSIYSVYWRGGTPGKGTVSIDDGVDGVIDHVQGAKGPTYSYLYIPDVDTLIHYRGFDHRDVLALTMYIDGELQRMAGAIGGKARIVVSADHGQTNVPVEDRLVLRDGDALLELLEVAPSGGAPLPLFHVKPGRADTFTRVFRDRYHERFVLLSIDQAEELELFGPGPIAPIAKRRFGDFVGIPLRPATLKHYHRGARPEMDYLGVHGSLLPDEMRVPLVVI